MRKSLISFLLITVSHLFFVSMMSANPRPLFDHDSAKSARNRPFRAFYSLSLGVAEINPSVSFNNWLLKEGYGPNKSNGFAISETETFFFGRWMSEFTEMDIKNNGFGNASEITNTSVGCGYNFLNTKGVAVYGALNLGANSFYFEPNQVSVGDFSRYNQPSGSEFVQYAFLINPHVLIYRNITNNLAARPRRISAIGAGIDAGFNEALWQSKWFYGYSNDRPFSAVKVSGIPNAAFSGFYIMGEIGWYFGWD